MPGCTKCGKRNLNLDYFSFPSDEELKKKWIDFLHDKNFRLLKKSKLCSEHFTEDCIATDGDKRFLKDGSVPSIEGKRKKCTTAKRKCILCGNNNADLAYFAVPKIEEMKQKWEKFLEFELDDKNYVLCHLHFKPSDIRTVNKKRQLLSNAIPSIFFDDYQFEFIPVDRKTNNGENSNDAECTRMIVDPTVMQNNDLNLRSDQNSGADSVISIDYTEYNTPPRTPSNKFAGNSITDDIVNIFIPSYEDSVINDDDTTTNNSNASEDQFNTSENSVYSISSNGRKRRMFYPGDFKYADITSLEIAKKSIENFRQLISKKNRTIKTLSLKAKRLADRNALLKETIRQLKAEKAAKEAKEKDNLFEVKGWWDS